MKPYEDFVDKMLKAVRSGQGKDPAAATAIIQQALKAAGLAGRGAAPQQAPDWAARFKPRRPGQGSRARTIDAAAHGPGQFLHGSFSNDAGTRRYRLYVPSRPASGPRPLVVMLHGCTQDPEDFAAGTTMNLQAEESGCLVLYPEQAGSANHSQCWNWFERSHQQRGEGEPSLIAGMTSQVMREHGADPARVYVAGLSAGGAMAAVMAATYPELYAAAGVHSGLPAGGAHDLMSGLNAMKGAPGKSRKAAALARPVPAIVFHGDRDAVVHPSNGQQVYRQLGGDAAAQEIEQPGAGHTRTMALDGGGRVLAEHWLLHGAGHAWSGGSAAGSYAEAAGPNASAEMLRFFLSR